MTNTYPSTSTTTSINANTNIQQVSFNNIQCFTDAGSNYNEDAFYTSDKTMIVTDGATGLYKTHVTNYDTDAQWLAIRATEMIGNCLDNEETATHTTLLSSETDALIPEVCKKVALTLANEYTDMCEHYQETTTTTTDNSIDPTATEATPSAGISIAHITGSTLEIYTLGDVTSIIQLTNGEVIMWSDENLGRLDKIAIDKMVELSHENGKPVSKQRELIQDVLRKHRALRNHEGSYWSFDVTVEGADKGYLQKYEINKVQSIALLTDGLADVVPLYQMCPNYQELLMAIKENGLETICKQMRILQANDPGYDIYPRFKMGDDATGVYVTLQ